MIYILEGHNCSGKTTYAEQLNIPIKKKAYHTLEDVQQALSNEQTDVVYDRLFGYGYLVYNKTDEDLKQLNEYLKSLPNVTCIKFTTSLESIIQRFHERYSWPEEYIQYKARKTFDFFNHMFEIMDVFKSIEEVKFK